MRKTIKQLQSESDYWRIKFINEQQRAEEAEALNNHLELAVRSAEGVSDALRRKLEAAESKLAELEKQQPMAYRWESPVNGKICYDGIKPLGVISQPLYLRPAPTVSLAELVPQRKPISMDAPISAEWAARTSGYRNGFNDCVDEILRNIEEAK